MSPLRLLLKSSRWTVIGAIVASILSGAANTGLLVLLNRSIATGSEQTIAVADSMLTGAGLFFGLCLLTFVLRLIAEIALIRLGQKTIYRLRLDLSRQIVGVSLPRLDKIGSPRLLSTLTEDVPTITNSVALLPMLSFSITIVLTCFVYLFTLSKAVFLAMVGFVIVGVVCYQYPIIRANRIFHQLRETNDQLYEHFRGLTHGLKELKTHRQRRRVFLDDVLDSTADDYRQLSVRGFSIYAAASSSGLLIAFGVLGLLVYVLPAYLDFGHETLIGYALVFLYMLTPLQEVMNALPGLNRAGVALRRIDRLGLELEAEDIHDGDLREVGWRQLELASATYSYRREGEDEPFVLGPIDLSLKPGELVFLVGGNGSGKTTLAKLLLGLYPPETGEIRLDGDPVTPANLESYRQLFSAVFSDFFLFDALLGLESPELDEQARDYLKRLQLSHKVQVTDGTISTTELSQGQRKRLALLTAFLEDRPIYLFDEWAADQDPSFKKLFYHVILPELKRRGKTVIAITHDDAYFQVADRVLALDYGRLVESPVSTQV